MKVLVLNCGSSSLKYQLINMETEEVLASGKYERIGEDEAFITHKVNGQKIEIQHPAKTHEEAVNFSLEQLVENYDDNEPVLPTNVSPNIFVNGEDIIDMKIDAEMSLEPMEFKTFCYLVESPNITEKDLEELIGKNYKLILENVKLWIKEYLEC